MTLRDPVAWAVVLVAVAVYANSFGNGFTLDDRSIVLENPKLESLARLPEYFTSDYWEPTVRAGLYRPLVTTTLALNHAAGGTAPWGYHAVNVGLHAVVSLLALALFRRVTDDAWVAAGAALYFATHAIHTEAVANVVGRGELLSAGFALLSLLAYARARDAEGDDARRPLAASVAAYGAALLCKENAITLLGLLVLWDLSEAAGGPKAFGRRLRRVVLPALGGRYAVYLGVTALYLLARSRVITDVQPTNALDNPLVGLAFFERLPTALVVGGKALGLLLAPIHLSYDYSAPQIPPVESIFAPQALLAAFGALALGAAWVWSWNGLRPLFFALGFTAITWSVVSNIVIPIGTILGERLLYLPSVGFCLAVAVALRAGLVRLVSAPAARVAFACALGIVVAANAVRTVVRNPDWASDDTIMAAGFATSPRSAKVLNNYAAIQLSQGELDGAIANLRRAAELQPGYGHAHASLGHALLTQGRVDEAIEQYEIALRIPWVDARLANNLGFLLIERGTDLERGLRLVIVGQREDPDNARYKDSLGWAYYKVGRPAEGLPWLQQAVAEAETESNRETHRRHLEEVEQALATGRGSAD